MYAWWEARNKANAGEGVRQTSQVVQHAAMLAVQTKPTREKEINKPPQPKRWTRPPEGLLKANCDGSFFSDSKKGGWGFIIRDHQGKALIAGCRMHRSPGMCGCSTGGIESRHPKIDLRDRLNGYNKGPAVG
jgi:hypothetical protein